MDGAHGNPCSKTAPVLTFNNDDPRLATEATLQFSGQLLKDLFDEERTNVIRGAIFRVLLDNGLKLRAAATDTYYTSSWISHSVTKEGGDGVPWPDYECMATVNLETNIKSKASWWEDPTHYYYGIMFLPDEKTLRQRAEEMSATATLLQDSYSISLEQKQSRYIKTSPLAELGGTAGLECDWYCPETGGTIPSISKAELSAIPDSEKGKARLNGHLTIELKCPEAHWRPPPSSDAQV